MNVKIQLSKRIHSKSKTKQKNKIKLIVQIINKKMSKIYLQRWNSSKNNSKIIKTLKKTKITINK